MITIIGKWSRSNVEMDISTDKIKTRVIGHEDGRTLVHDYLIENDVLQLFNPSIREVKSPFKGEARVSMSKHNSLSIEMNGNITFWTRR